MTEGVPGAIERGLEFSHDRRVIETQKGSSCRCSASVCRAIVGGSYRLAIT
jgi:hypothetical protein